jgi:hypothetical protein
MQTAFAERSGITEIDELGRISGTLFDEPIAGWWSERGRCSSPFSPSAMGTLGAFSREGLGYFPNGAVSDRR